MASPCECWDKNRLSPKPRIASLPLFHYLFILVFYSVASLPPLQALWFMGRVRHLSLLQPDSMSRAHDPAPELAVHAALILPSHLLRPFSSALAAEWVKYSNSITARGRGG